MRMRLCKIGYIAVALTLALSLLIPITPSGDGSFFFDAEGAPTRNGDNNTTASENAAPRLYNGHYTDVEDEWNTYVFYVVYQDDDNDAPASIAVVLDNVGYPLERLTEERAASIENLSGYPTAFDGDHSNYEAYYRKVSNLSRGEHTYRFQATDGHSAAVAGEQYVPVDEPLLMSAEGPDKPEGETSSPGFELALLIGAVVVTMFYLNRKEAA